MYYLYILQSETKLYIGITKNLDCRLKQHRSGHGADYTSNFSDGKLVYSETFKNRENAEKREKQLKGWSRQKKEALINQDFLLLKKLSSSKNSELDEGKSDNS